MLGMSFFCCGRFRPIWGFDGTRIIRIDMCGQPQCLPACHCRRRSLSFFAAGRWLDNDDRDARCSLLRDSIVDAMHTFGVALAPSDAAVDEHKDKVLIAQGYPQQKFPFSKRIPLDNTKVSDHVHAHASTACQHTPCTRV